MSRTHMRGFTLIEIVLVVALVSILAGAGLRLPYLFLPAQTERADVFAVVVALYRAQTLAATGRGVSDWGVYVAEDSVTVFEGESYAGRVSTFDEVVEFDADAATASESEIIFRHDTGMPADAATVSMRFGALQTFITVNTYGTVDIH